MIGSKDLDEDYLLNDTSDVKAFLQEAEMLLDQGHFRATLDLARERNMHLPGDIDARFIMVRAFNRLGLHDEAAKITREVRETLDRWNSMMQAFQEPTDLKKNLAVQAIESELSGLMPETTSEEPSSLSLQQENVEDDSETTDESDPSVILEAFYTPTMAELFVHQGHIDMAHEIYSGLLKKHPTNPVFRERIRDLSLLLQSNDPREDPEKQGTVIDELERWISKIKKTA